MRRPSFIRAVSVDRCGTGGARALKSDCRVQGGCVGRIRHSGSRHTRIRGGKKGRGRKRRRRGGGGCSLTCQDGGCGCRGIEVGVRSVAGENRRRDAEDQRGSGGNISVSSEDSPVADGGHGPGI
jgi:hypothetical protein